MIVITATISYNLMQPVTREDITGQAMLPSQRPTDYF